jgi:phosphoglycerate dehydrogenase-like enzyme
VPDRPLVIQAEELDAPAAAWLAERARLEVCRFDSGARFQELLALADGVVVRTYCRVDQTFLDRAPKLKVVGRAGVGLDRIDVETCRARGVEVVHTPDANTTAVAEYVFALLLDETRPRVVVNRALDLAQWNKVRKELEARRQLREMTLGIWGMGRVGRAVTRIAAGIGMRVIYHDLLDITPDQRFGATPVSRGELLRESDVLSVHVDARASNRHLVNAEALALLKHDAILVNTSRGFVVDDEALRVFLLKNGAARAILDVHDPEPIEPFHPLLGVPNASLSPHLAAATRLAHANMSLVVRDVWNVLCGEKPEHPAPGVML